MALSLEFAAPDGSLLHLPPFRDPPIVTAPVPSAPSWRCPIPIQPHLYAAALDRRVPLTIAATYAVTAVLLNRFNTRRNYKPWRVSRTRAFRAFVVAHNVFLAIYSAWTFMGMVTMLREGTPSWAEYRQSVYGRSKEEGGLGAGLLGYAIEVVDAFTHVNGAKGLGNAIYFDHVQQRWASLNPQASPLVVASYISKDTGAAGSMIVPDPTTPGRFWNSGLAYFGWLFYVSKFYEVIDTLIILAKGKKSSTLQTYHHAGAMLCMWAGIRYTAAPIWIFPTFNSLIHALMYTYYTLTAFHVPVPVAVKRSLTTMQIIQFIIGVVLASSYLLVRYTIPIAQPVVATAGGLAAVTATAGNVGGLVRNLVGLVMPDGSSKPASAHASARETETVYRSMSFNAIDSPGQAFGVWLNVLYLLPLTWLFARFFVRSYIKRASQVAAISAKSSKANLGSTSIGVGSGTGSNASASGITPPSAASAPKALRLDDTAFASSSEETLVSSPSSSDDELRHNLSQQVVAGAQLGHRRRSSVTLQSLENAELAGLDALRKVGREIRRFPAAQDGTGMERRGRPQQLAKRRA
ncbi:hypothetical protein KEM52_005403 [Ascosphaera acerosa]|nr:hypothetical protein KEM52_005403 [Ascosphaera acerosa]